MGFTDEDLKKFKKWLDTPKFQSSPVGFVEKYGGTFKALLHRLQCAEALIDCLRPLHLHSFPTKTGDQCEIFKALETWCGAKGDMSESGPFSARRD